MMSRKILIGRPWVHPEGGRMRLSSMLQVDGESRELWFEVPNEYGQYLCHERSDGFLIGVLHCALTQGYDIECEASVSEELLYNLTKVLIPALVRGDDRLYRVVITATPDATELPNAGAVGCGMSCGVDSMHTFANERNTGFEHFNLTHFIIYNVGAYTNAGQRNWQLARAHEVAERYHMPLIETNSNLSAVIRSPHVLANTYRNCFAIYLLQKFWRTYYLASVGVGYEKFNLKNNSLEDCAHYDLLSLSCFSTRQLRIYSEGGEKTRFEKLQLLVDFDPAREYLHCCVADNGDNCGSCLKCCGLLVSLDALGKLDEFSKVIDVNRYRRRRWWYLGWLKAMLMLGIKDDEAPSQAYDVLRKDMGLMAYLTALYIFLKEKGRGVRLLKWMYSH